MRAVAYLHVSSLSQLEGHSLEAQERLFYEACKNNGWEPVKIYCEAGKLIMSLREVWAAANLETAKDLTDHAGCRLSRCQASQIYFRY